MLQAALARLCEHRGVDQVVLFGWDGLVVDHCGGDPEIAEMIAATVPAVAAAADAVGQQLDRGRSGTLVTELHDGVVVAHRIADDLLLAALVQPGFAFGELIADLRSHGRNFSRLL